jgi:hypothetical protein
MIPAVPGQFKVLFDNESLYENYCTDVIAFDEDGIVMILSMNSGELVRVTHIGGFIGVTLGDTREK